jgi:predicted nuclease with TOPRIM domain
MSEESTGRLNDGGSFESKVLEQFAALRESVNSLGGRLSGIEERLSSVEVRLSELEEKVDARLRETRPIWENVLSQLEKIDSKLNVLGLDLLDTRGDVEMLKKRPPAA